MSIPSKVPKGIFLSGLFIVAAGLPVSKFLMSAGQFIMLAGLILDGRWMENLKRFWKNKMAVLAGSVILMHLLGLIYTSDYAYAFKDIRIKAPLLLMPLFIAGTEPLSRKFFNRLMGVFIASVTAGTLVCIAVYYGIIPSKHPEVDSRDISIFISHIRFSLMIVLAVYLTAYYFYSTTSTALRIFYAGLITWMIVFLTFLNSLTGLALLVIVFLILLLYRIFTVQNFFIKSGSFLLLAAVFSCLFYYMDSLLRETAESSHSGIYNDLSKLEKKTATGHDYVHYTESTLTENGNLVYIYLCEQEMSKEWNKRSSFPYTGNDKKGNQLKYTLMRYLTSRGLRKDSAGISLLSNEEIKSIENGLSNVNYLGKSRLSIRLMETLWEFRIRNLGNSPNGHSVVMRIEFWKAALGIIRNNLLTGVGTGDIKNAFDSQYRQMNSTLEPEYRLRSHDQFLSIAVAFGIPGLIWFLAALICPMILCGKTMDYFYVVFFIIAFLSMITEDTLETQAGVTFYAFFNSLFLFARPLLRQPLRKG